MPYNHIKIMFCRRGIPSADFISTKKNTNYKNSIEICVIMLLLFYVFIFISQGLPYTYAVLHLQKAHKVCLSNNTK